MTMNLPMIKPLRFYFLPKKSGKVELQFNERDPVTNQIKVAYVFLTSVTGFGLIHQEVLTKEGTFKSWQKAGYISTSKRKYFISYYLYLDAKDFFKKEIVSEVKEKIVGVKKTGAPVKAINKHYKIK